MTDPSAHVAKPKKAAESFRQDVLGLTLLAAGSLGIGLLVNGLRPAPLPLVYTSPTDRLRQAVARVSTAAPASRPSVPASGRWQTIGLDEFQELVTTHQGMVIDARSRALYQAGHVPGAFCLPRDEFEQGYANARRSLEAAREGSVVVYCSEADCKDSELVADALSRLGYRHLSVYREGWEEWRRAGLPQAVGDTR